MTHTAPDAATSDLEADLDDLRRIGTDLTEASTAFTDVATQGFAPDIPGIFAGGDTVPHGVQRPAHGEAVGAAAPAARTTRARAYSSEVCDLSAFRPLMRHAEPVATA